MRRYALIRACIRAMISTFAGKSALEIGGNGRKSETGKTLQFRQHCGIVDYRKILLEARNCEAKDA